MASLNRVTVMGNLGADPEVKFAQNGNAIAQLRMACTEKWTDKNTGQKQERTEWVHIVVFGKQAENCGEYLRKGQQALVEGRMQTREWQDKDGNKRWTTEVVANNVVFLGGRQQEQAGGGGYSSQGSTYGAPSEPEDSIPF